MSLVALTTLPWFSTSSAPSAFWPQPSWPSSCCCVSGRFPRIPGARSSCDEWLGSSHGICWRIFPQLGHSNSWHSNTGWWFGTWMDYDFPYIGKFIIPTDDVIFFKGVQTTNQYTAFVSRIFLFSLLGCIPRWARAPEHHISCLWRAVCLRFLLRFAMRSRSRPFPALWFWLWWLPACPFWLNVFHTSMCRALPFQIIPGFVFSREGAPTWYF